ncbi:hypothetical protein F6X42_41130 [Paraburkholderia sp. WC7.3b]|uniref:DDE domain-containing protein n=1 Tax=Paraburkholderia podalyriae TaxID=1938811 RepID=A0ABR7Q1Z4_9BURK|nr:hypothetical protein [Paraburkholderia podalyriae]
MRGEVGSTSHLDEVFVKLRGEPYVLWRAVDEQRAHCRPYSKASRQCGRCSRTSKMTRIDTCCGTRYAASPATTLYFRT